MALGRARIWLKLRICTRIKVFLLCWLLAIILELVQLSRLNSMGDVWGCLFMIEDIEMTQQILLFQRLKRLFFGFLGLGNLKINRGCVD